VLFAQYLLRQASSTLLRELSPGTSTLQNRPGIQQSALSLLTTSAIFPSSSLSERAVWRRAPHPRRHDIVRHRATVVEARTESIGSANPAAWAETLSAHADATAWSTHARPHRTRTSLPEAALTAHRTSPAGVKPATLGNPLADANTLRVRQHRHGRRACRRIVADDDLPQSTHRIRFRAECRNLRLRRAASARPDRVEASPEPAAKRFVPLQQAALDRIELCELPRAQVQLAAHVDQWRDRVAACPSHARSHAPLCVQRDRHRQRNCEDGGAPVELPHFDCSPSIPLALVQ
jgi:hypothetical protein